MPNITKNVLRFGVIVFLVALLLALPVSTASAALRTCRTDPIVMLSDGSKVSLTAMMATDAANVRLIKYDLHVPMGTSVVKVVFTGGDFAHKEMIMVWFDQPAGKYKSETVVHGNTGRFEVTAQTMLMVGVIAQAHGMNGDRLLVEIGDPGTASRNVRPPRGK